MYVEIHILRLKHSIELSSISYDKGVGSIFLLLFLGSSELALMEIRTS